MKKGHNVSTSLVDELRKLCDAGYGQIVTREEIVRDKISPFSKAFSVYMKPYHTFLDQSFFDMASDKKLKRADYIDNFNDRCDEAMLKICKAYHPQKDVFLRSPRKYVPARPTIGSMLDSMPDLLHEGKIHSSYYMLRACKYVMY